MKVHEQYKPITVDTNSTAEFHANTIGGFIGKTAGTVTVTTANGIVIVDAFPVVAGRVLPLPLLLPNGEQGGTVTTAGGASGIFCV